MARASEGKCESSAAIDRSSEPPDSKLDHRRRAFGAYRAGIAFGLENTIHDDRQLALHGVRLTIGDGQGVQSDFAGFDSAAFANQLAACAEAAKRIF